jgi:hypothetical protein
MGGLTLAAGIGACDARSAPRTDLDTLGGYYGLTVLMVSGADSIPLRGWLSIRSSGDSVIGEYGLPGNHFQPSRGSVTVLDHRPTRLALQLGTPALTGTFKGDSKSALWDGSLEVREFGTVNAGNECPTFAG